MLPYKTERWTFCNKNVFCLSNKTEVLVQKCTKKMQMKTARTRKTHSHKYFRRIYWKIDFGAKMHHWCKNSPTPVKGFPLSQFFLTRRHHIRQIIHPQTNFRSTLARPHFTRPKRREKRRFSGSWFSAWGENIWQDNFQNFKNKLLLKRKSAAGDERDAENLLFALESQILWKICRAI